MTEPGSDWRGSAHRAVRMQSWWPHYFSTYCIHENHDQCRLTCKTCGAPCKCSCHVTAAAPGARSRPPAKRRRRFPRVSWGYCD